MLTVLIYSRFSVVVVNSVVFSLIFSNTPVSQLLCPSKSGKYVLNPNAATLKKSFVSAPPSHLHPIIRSISVFLFRDILINHGFFTWDPKIASKGSNTLSEIENSFWRKGLSYFCLSLRWIWDPQEWLGTTFISQIKAFTVPFPQGRSHLRHQIFRVKQNKHY